MKVKSESEVTQSCPTLCDPIDGSPPGSPVPGILQARTLEWVAIAFSTVTVSPLLSIHPREIFHQVSKVAILKVAFNA